MNKLNCQYVIVRFLPFIETGEFANAGVMLIAPEAQVFTYKLQNKRYKRYTDFFENLPRNAFRAHTESLEGELESLKNLLMRGGFDKRLKESNSTLALSLFEDLVRPRDGFIQYSKPRSILTDDPTKTCEDLFKFYVEREFVKKESAELPLEKHISSVLRNQGLSEYYRQEDIGDAVFQARFPFVRGEKQAPKSAIKAINLNHDNPSKIVDYGGHWVYRIQELKRRAVLPARVLFAYERPVENKSDVNGFKARQVAFSDIHNQLSNLGVELSEFCDDRKLIDFANDEIDNSLDFNEH